MNVVIINNGLGNQMSQYAFYVSMKKYRKNCIAIFDPFSLNEHNGSEIDTLFKVQYDDNIMAKIAHRIFLYSRRPKIWRVLSFCGVRIIRESINYDFNPSYLKYRRFGITFFLGGWHSEKYFKSIEAKVRKIYCFNEDIIFNSEVKRLSEEIKACPSAVSLHVRRGDFLKIEKNNPYQLGGVVDENYYKRAIDYIQGKIISPTFYCFSDDLDWCKSEFKNLNVIYVDCNRGKDSWKDMYLMSLCKYHINANSTFSWWGAWLSSNQNGVTICPDRFLRNVITKDIYPETWIKVSTSNQL